ncbi:hypothetical protein GGR54DRAFT_595432 [Hypoxylon sp. NC1633]|nr:hypothetical protein GGR54DRAFT_595432 [Hypoxylon sp. NC1633]
MYVCTCISISITWLPTYFVLMFVMEAVLCRPTRFGDPRSPKTQWRWVARYKEGELVDVGRGFLHMPERIMHQGPIPGGDHGSNLKPSCPGDLG